MLAVLFYVFFPFVVIALGVSAIVLGYMLYVKYQVIARDERENGRRK